MLTAKKYLDKFLSWASIILFALLVCVVVFQVLDRHIFHTKQGLTEELARYVFVWLGFFATALVFSERGHIAVDFVVRKFSPAGQKIISVCVQITIIVFAAVVFVWGGFRAALGAMSQQLASMPMLSVGQMYMIMPLAGLLIIFYAVVHLFENLSGAVDPYAGEDEEVAAALAAVAADETLAAEVAAHGGPMLEEGKK